MTSAAIIQPFGSHDEIIPSLYRECVKFFDKVDIFIPESLFENRGNIFRDLGIEASINFFKDGRKGIQSIRKRIDKSGYDLAVIATFSNYLKNLDKPTIRVIHNADREIGRTKEGEIKYDPKARYIVLGEFVKNYLINNDPNFQWEDNVEVLYPFYFGEIESSPEFSRPINLTAIGRINGTKKYMPLLDSIRKNKDFLSDNGFTFTIIGSSGNIYENFRDAVKDKNLTGFFRFVPENQETQVTSGVVVGNVKASDFLLPLTSGGYYNEKKISATYSWGVGLGIPFINNCCEAEDFPKSSICYEDVNFIEAFRKISEMNSDDYFDMHNNLLEYRRRALSQNTEAFKKLCKEIV